MGPAPFAGRQPTDDVRMLFGKNISGQDIPPYSLVRMVRYVRDATARTGYFEIDKPNQDSYPWVLGVTLKNTIRANKTGLFTSDFPNWVRYSNYNYSGDNYYQPQEYSPYYGEVPQVGDEWGPASGALEIHEDQTGFRILGVDPVARLAMVDRLGGTGSGSGSDGLIDSSASLDGLISCVGGVATVADWYVAIIDGRIAVTDGAGVIISGG